MRNLKLSLFLGLMLLHTSAAYADPAGAPADETSRFSMGAGIGYGDNGGLGGLGYVGYGSTAAASYAVQGRAPYGTAIVEAILSRRLRLGLGAQGSYSHSGERNPSSTGQRLPAVTVGGVAASVSMRWILNPGGVVEVSPLFAVGAYRTSARGMQAGQVQRPDGAFEFTTADARGLGLGGRLGLVLEYRLLPQLFLRFESYFVSADYGSVRTVSHIPGKDPKERVKEARVSGGFSPALQLRLTF